jgi:hypothetical protein
MKTSPSNLPLPPLSKSDNTAIKALHQSWSIHALRMAQLTPECVLADQKAALQAFLATPSQENEQRLAVMADERLVKQRYRVLFQAHEQLACQTKTRAIAIVRCHLTGLLEAATLSLRRIEEEARKEGRVCLTDEACAEMRQLTDQLDQHLRQLEQAEVTGADWPEGLLLQPDQ